MESQDWTDSIRILVVTSYYGTAYEFGGPALSVPELCRALTTQGLSVTVYSTTARRGRPDDPEHSAVVDGVNVTWFARSFGLSPFASKRLCDAIETTAMNFDVLLLSNLFADGFSLACRSSFKAGIPYVVSPRGQLIEAALRQKALKKRIYLRFSGRRDLERAAAIHCTGEAEAHALRRMGINTQCWTVPNIVSGFDGAGHDENAQRSASRPPVVMFAGRLHRHKRPDIAIRAFGAVVSGGIDATLVVIGPDEQGLQPELVELAGQMGVADRVAFAGALTPSELRDRMSSASVLLLPSEHENFGMVAAEAASRGMAVLASTEVPAAVALSSRGAAWVRPSSVDNFAVALKELLENPEARERIAKAGPGAVKALFSADSIGREFAEKLRDLVARKPVVRKSET